MPTTFYILDPPPAAEQRERAKQAAKEKVATDATRDNERIRLPRIGFASGPTVSFLKRGIQFQAVYNPGRLRRITQIEGIETFLAEDFLMWFARWIQDPKFIAGREYNEEECYKGMDKPLNAWIGAETLVHDPSIQRAEKDGISVGICLVKLCQENKFEHLLKPLTEYFDNMAMISQNAIKLSEAIDIKEFDDFGYYSWIHLQCMQKSFCEQVKYKILQEVDVTLKDY